MEDLNGELGFVMLLSQRAQRAAGLLTRIWRAEPEPYRGVARRGDAAFLATAAAFDFKLSPAERAAAQTGISEAVDASRQFLDEVSGRPDRLELIVDHIFGSSEQL